MKPIDEFFSELRSLDVKVWLDGEQLRLKAPKENLTPTLLQELKERKAEILTFLHNANSATHNSSLVTIQPNGSKPPLFFTNSIGAAKTLATFLSSEQPVYGLSIFGLPEMDENQLSSLRIEDIAKQFIQDMRHIQPTGPYFLAAYCGDARIAFEMAQQLYAQGQKVARLAFIDVVWNPENLGTSLYWQNFNQLGFEYLIKKIKGRLNRTRKRIVRNISKIQSGLTHKIEENSDIQIKHQKLLQAFYQASQTYVPQTYPGQITLFLSREWRLKNTPELANLAAGGLETQEIPGYHNLLFKEPYIQLLAEKIQTCIDTAKTTLSESNSTNSRPSTTTGIQTRASFPNQLQESASYSSLVPIQPNGSKPPLFCIHALGISVLYYRDLARYLGSEQPFYALQPQGLDGKQTPLTRIEDMAAHYIKEIQTIQPHGPYYLGGSSMGGQVAWEIAQQLIAQGEKVALLALFDSTAPNYLKRIPLLKRIPHHLDSLQRFGLNYLLKKIKGKIQWLKNRLNDSKQTLHLSIKADSPQTSHHLAIEQANKQAARDYILQVYPGQVTLFRASDRPAPEGWEVDLKMGWDSLVTGGLDIQDIPGDHDSMFREPHVQVLAEKLRRCLEKAVSNLSRSHD